MSELVVLDTSVAMSWVLPDEHANATQSLKRNAVEDPQLQLMVPPIFWSEVTNVLAVAVQQSRVSIEWAKAALGALLTFDIAEYNVEPFNNLLAAVSDRLSAYDAQYVVLAQQTAGTLWTLDQRLAAAARGRGISVAP
jgi:predicted nucleic acid-binding protein